MGHFSILCSISYYCRITSNAHMSAIATPSLDYGNTLGGSGVLIVRSASSISYDDHEVPAKKISWGKLLLGAILLSTITFVIVDSITTKHITNGFQSFLIWIETNLVAGFFAFVAVDFFATIAFLPGMVLTMGGGFVFGKALGIGPGVALTTLGELIGTGAVPSSGIIIWSSVCFASFFQICFAIYTNSAIV